MSDAPSKTNPQGPSLDHLLARVEAATGPDRELDRALWAEFQGGDYPGVLTWDGDGVAPFTVSLDAAFALRNRLFPTWHLFVGDLDPRDCRAVATLAQGYPDQPSYRGFAPCQEYARALLAALLKAVQAQSQGQFHDGASLEPQAPAKMDGDLK